MHSKPTVKSRFFGRRQSRPLKPEADEAYNRLLPQLKIDLNDLDLSAERILLEIGFGGGEHLAQQAVRYPETLFLGCEPYVNGVGSLLKQIDSMNLNNIRIHDADAQKLLEILPNTSLDGAFLLFADPWPKKRHHKRRFIQIDTIEMLHRLLKPGGFWKIATDHANYREWILDHFAKVPHLFKQTRENIYERPPVETWPITRYEEFATKEGRHSGYMIYERL